MIKLLFLVGGLLINSSLSQNSSVFNSGGRIVGGKTKLQFSLL
jgi:trypsin